MKRLPIAIVGIATLFLLAGCDSNDPGSAGNETESTLDEQRLLSLSFTITATGANDNPDDDRQLQVSTLAYCEKLDDLSMDEYNKQCGQYVQEQLEYHATDRKCFEGSIPAISTNVRNHDNLPSSDNGYCHDVYPENYSTWTEDMMRRALNRPTKDNFYTVTDIKPL